MYQIGFGHGNCSLLANLLNEVWLWRVRDKCTLWALKSGRKPSGSVAAWIMLSDKLCSQSSLLGYTSGDAHVDAILAS